MKKKFNWSQRKPGKNDSLFYRLRDMPPLNHWPDRSVDFDYNKSEVVQYILEMIRPEPLARAISLFAQAQRKACILFDPDTKLWAGNKDWESTYTLPPEACEVPRPAL